jgi:DNA-binding GntR family transcriptional regulator
MMTAPATPTRTAGVFQELRHSVVSGRLRPGERLKLAELCEQYGVSLSVVREAVTRLAEQGLVRAERNRGFRVTPLSLADLEDLTIVRVEIESLCLRRSMEFGDTSWEAGVVAAHHTLSRAAATATGALYERYQAVSAAHSSYHAALAAGCHSPRLIAIRQNLFDCAELYRGWSVTISEGQRHPEGEHAAILEAILAGDCNSAVAQLAGHIRETSRWLAQSHASHSTHESP